MSTPAEKSCYRTTPRYAETMRYVRRIAWPAPRQVKIEKFGVHRRGRALVAVVVSRDGEFSPAALHSGKRPVIFIQIDSRWRDGRQRCVVGMLRDIRVTEKRLD